jgi:glutamine amidotransferase
MCQLLGMSCNVPTDIIFSFSRFVPRAGITDHHSDGWGIAFFEGPCVRHFIDQRAATDSPLADLVQRWPIKSTNVIAHIRKATQGRVALENCHPFTRELWGRHWVFAHNGDLKEFEPVLDGSFHPVGSTDSERAFCYLLQEMRRQFGPTAPSQADLTLFLRHHCAELAKHGPFNMLFSDGNAMYVHCSTNLHYIVRQPRFAHAALCDEEVKVAFTEPVSPKDKVAIIATSPLTSDEIWCQMMAGQFLVFVDGVALS